jgi:hypothetical protein
MSTIRPSSRVRYSLGLGGISLCTLCAIAGFSSIGGLGAGVSQPGAAMLGQARSAPVLTGFTADRLMTEVAAKYGFHFMSAAAPADPGGVDMSTARDAGGDQLRVILFGRTPGPVRAVFCEISPPRAADGVSPGTQTTSGATVPADAVVGFLGACTRITVAADQAAAVARWLTAAQAALAAEPADGTSPVRLTRSAGFSSVRYAVRRVPDTGEWIMSMTGAAP